MKEITLYRGDFQVIGNGQEVDHFSDIVIKLGLAKDYSEAYEIDAVTLDTENARSDIF